MTEVTAPRSVDGLETYSIQSAARGRRLPGRRSGAALPLGAARAHPQQEQRTAGRRITLAGAASRCADLIRDAFSRHEKTTERKPAAAARARATERKKLAECARANLRKVDDRDRSVSLRTVSGGLPTLGRRSR
ncbi:hypothetical protein JCM4914_75050 [Streptomyces platensis subsp. malvinus]